MVYDILCKNFKILSTCLSVSSFMLVVVLEVTILQNKISILPDYAFPMWRSNLFHI